MRVASRLFKVWTESQTTLSSSGGMDGPSEPRLQSGGTWGSGLGTNDGRGWGECARHQPTANMPKWMMSASELRHSHANVTHTDSGRSRRQTLAGCQDHPAQGCPHHRQDMAGR